MSEPTVIPTKRNVAIGLGVAAALLLAAVGYSYFFGKTDPPDSVVNVIQKKLDVPLDLERVFTGLGVKGLILVSGGGEKNEPLTIRVMNPKGDIINVCGPGSENPGSETVKSPQSSCQLTTPAAPLLSIASEAPTCGFCSDQLNRLRECHKNGQYKDKWYCHLDPNDASGHQSCKRGNSCG